MRGGVSLAAALALPLTAAGGPFPDRANVIFISYIVIAATLVIPGLTLSPLVRRLGLGEEEAVAREEARARVQLAHAALKHIEDLAEREATGRTSRGPTPNDLRATNPSLRAPRRREPGPRRRGCGRPPDPRAAAGANRRRAPPSRVPPPARPDLSPIPAADRTRTGPRGISTSPMRSLSSPVVTTPSREPAEHGAPGRSRRRVSSTEIVPSS